MERIALLLAIATLTSAIEWTNFHVKFGLSQEDPLRNDSFFAIPRTRHDAEEQGWVQARGITTARVTIYCMADDPRLCVLFNSYGYITGVQAGILVSDVANMQEIYNMSHLNQYRIKRMFGKDVWTGTAYFEDPDVIAAGGRSSTWDNLTGTEGVWLDTTDGYVYISRNTVDLDPVWISELCYPAMGDHWYYDMYKTKSCKDIQPWFTFSHKGTIIGIGFQGFGNVTMTNRDWNEPLSTAAIEKVIITAPECMFDWLDAYGIISMHMYFIAEPWSTPCSSTSS